MYVSMSVFVSWQAKEKSVYVAPTPAKKKSIHKEMGKEQSNCETVHFSPYLQQRNTEVTWFRSVPWSILWGTDLFHLRPGMDGEWVNP